MAVCEAWQQFSSSRAAEGNHARALSAGKLTSRDAWPWLPYCAALLAPRVSPAPELLLPWPLRPPLPRVSMAARQNGVGKPIVCNRMRLSTVGLLQPACRQGYPQNGGWRGSQSATGRALCCCRCGRRVASCLEPCLGATSLSGTTVATRRKVSHSDALVLCSHITRASRPGDAGSFLAGKVMPPTAVLRPCTMTGVGVWQCKPLLGETETRWPHA
jgi:hypothetical protein